MKRKAFTLTELLVVVVIIATLSAVVLPKFTKILEARKTTEAENIMRAVRSEQEARCMLDKNYTADEDKLASYPKNEGNNYDYELTTTGMSATSKSKNYTLEMLTYLDGGICCSGAYCSSLNKNYPDCKDYEDVVKANTECAAQDLPGPLPPVVEECANAGEYTSGATFTETDAEGCTVTKEWTLSAYPACEWTSSQVDKTCPEECANADEHTSGATFTETDAEGCTVTKKWTLSAYPACEWTSSQVDKTCPEECQPPEGRSSYEEKECSNGQSGKITFTWNTSSCKYSVRDTCSDCVPTNKQGCETDFGGRWDSSKCVCQCQGNDRWDGERCVDVCENAEERQELCEQIQDGHQIAGRWFAGGNGLACRCVCPPFSSRGSDGSCYEDRDAGTRSWRDCDELYGGEWCDQWAEDLGGADLEDLLRFGHFYNSDNPEWWDDYEYETGDGDWNF